MSLTRAQRARLGIFLIIGSFVLLLFFSIPLGFKLTNKYKSYIAFFKGESLSGLEQGAIVKFSGVPIGKVEKITYMPKDLSKVKVTLKIDDDFPMKVDMVATTNAMGITGLKYVEITGGSDNAELLPNNAELKTKVSMMSTITGKAEVIAAKVEMLLNHLNEITDADSIVAIKQIIQNAKSITDEFNLIVKEARPQITSLTATANKITSKVDSITTDIQSFSTALNREISPQDLARTFNRVDSTAKAMKDLSISLSLMVSQTREDFSVGMKNIREATENANQLTKVLSENPSLLLKGENQRERVIR
jgi:ABC-type transporter Mla subunit MlaD